MHLNECPPPAHLLQNNNRQRVSSVSCPRARRTRRGSGPWRPTVKSSGGPRQQRRRQQQEQAQAQERGWKGAGRGRRAGMSVGGSRGRRRRRPPRRRPRRSGVVVVGVACTKQNLRARDSVRGGYFPLVAFLSPPRRLDTQPQPPSPIPPNHLLPAAAGPPLPPPPAAAPAAGAGAEEVSKSSAFHSSSCRLTRFWRACWW